MSNSAEFEGRVAVVTGASGALGSAVARAFTEAGDEGALLAGGRGDGPYCASKAAVRLLTETIAAENRGTVRANAALPSVIDTPADREMMPDADHDTWPDPAGIAAVMLFLASDAASVTSGAAVPVYGEAGSLDETHLPHVAPELLLAVELPATLLADVLVGHGTPLAVRTGKRSPQGQSAYDGGAPVAGGTRPRRAVSHRFLPGSAR